MKYIGNAFSPAMINDEDGSVHLVITSITKSQFLKVRDKCKSIMGHPEIAEYFDLPFNRESIRLHRGDILYIVLPLHRYRAGEQVKYGDKYEFIPEEQGYTYKMIQVLEK